MATLETRNAQFRHLAFFYRGTAAFLDVAVPFVRAGLAVAEPVAVVVPAPHLRLILAELGTDVDLVQALDMARVGRNPNRIIPGVLAPIADAHAEGRVRILSESVWPGRLLRELGPCAQHEALVNFAFAHRPLTMLCGFDEELAPEVLADAEATHPVLCGAAGERRSTRYAPERVLGQHNRPLPAPAAPTLTFDAVSLGQARRFASEQATRLGLGGDHTELELIVGELTANTIAHGGGTGALSLWAEDGHLVCEVRDAGHITDPLAGRRRADPAQTGGRGLLLVNHLADLVHLHTGPDGTTIRAFLALPFAGDQAGGGSVPQIQVTRAPTLRTGYGLPPGQAPLRWQTHDALRTASRFTRYLRGPNAAGEQAGERPQLRPVLEALAAAEALAQNVEGWRVRLVRLARKRGARWTDIGRALGVSKQAAHERYGESRRRGAARETD